jgi:hypothetical protein
VHVGGRWYPKGTEPKTENTKIPKQVTNEDRVKIVPKSTKPVEVDKETI